MDSANYVEVIIETFSEQRNEANAIPMAKYMRDKFPFFGIKSPERRGLLKEVQQLYGLPDVNVLPSLATALWALPERELHYAALDLTSKLQKKLREEDLLWLEQLAVTKSWWDTVDYLSTIIGKHFLKFPQLKLPHVKRWIADDNIWLQRIAIIFQLKYKEQTDEQLLFDCILARSTSDDFFVQKGMGWALRQYSKVNAEAVLAFISEQELPSLTKREALKWLNRKGSAA